MERIRTGAQSVEPGSTRAEDPGAAASRPDRGGQVIVIRDDALPNIHDLRSRHRRRQPYRDDRHAGVHSNEQLKYPL